MRAQDAPRGFDIPLRESLGDRVMFADGFGCIRRGIEFFGGVKVIRDHAVHPGHQRVAGHFKDDGVEDQIEFIGLQRVATGFGYLARRS